MISEQIVAKALLLNGAPLQMTIAIEELAELTKCITKLLRSRENPDGPTLEQSVLRGHMVEEIADVRIGIEHLKQIYGVSEEEIEIQLDRKLRRLQRRNNDA